MSSIDPEAEGSERRRFPRVRLNMLVQFRVDSYDEFLKHYATDLSTGGMFVRTDEPREMGAMVYFQFMVRGGESIIQGLGRVVHVNPPGGERPAGMGIEFVSLEEESASVVDSIVSSRIAQGEELLD